VLLILLILLLAAFVYGYLRVDAQARTDEAQRVDAIIVLGSAVWPNERPSPSLAARTEHAIALYQAGYAPNLILCGGLGYLPPAEAEVMRRMAVSAGIPDDALFLDDTSHSTGENLAHAREIMNAHGWRTALIVSDPFHLWRALTIARDLGIEAYGSPASASPTYTIPHLRVYYTAREVFAMLWYAGEKTFGKPTWLYRVLKGRM
jgi:uncharacterized SAM-binding protein YcdF (DUF218 family)